MTVPTQYLPCAHLAEGWCWPCVRRVEADAKEACVKIAEGYISDVGPTDTGRMWRNSTAAAIATDIRENA